MKELGTLRLREMALTQAEKQHEEMVQPHVPSYPYGLRLSLGEEELKKLGIDMPNLDDTFLVIGVGKVKEVSEREYDDHTHKHVEIQLEKLTLEPQDVVKLGKVEAA
jgi:hypothetical protein